jgi:hypothetical protein
VVANGEAVGRSTSESIASLQARAATAENKLRDYLKVTEFYYDIRHRVYLDGAPGSGKSALVAKWVNPTVDIDKLRKSQGVSDIKHFLCREPFSDPNFPDRISVRRHWLDYFDVPGEQPELIRELSNEQPPEVLVFVVDPDHLEASVDRFSLDRFVFLYGGKDLQSALKSCILYVSKADRFEPGARDQIQNVVLEKILPLFVKAKLKPTFVFGSARTGEGLTQALGAILLSLGLERYLERHQSLAS